MIVCVGRENMHTFLHYGDQSPIVLQVSLGIICVFCLLAHVLSSKNPFAFPACTHRFLGSVHTVSKPRGWGLVGIDPRPNLLVKWLWIGEMTMKFSSFKVLFFKLYKRFWRVIFKTFFFTNDVFWRCHTPSENLVFYLLGFWRTGCTHRFFWVHTRYLSHEAGAWWL